MEEIKKYEDNKNVDKINEEKSENNEEALEKFPSNQL